jgi:hypothetical protein
LFVVGVVVCLLTDSSGQTATPHVLDFPSVPLSAKIAVNANNTSSTNISAADAGYTLEIAGANADQFTGTLKAAPTGTPAVTPPAPVCTDKQLKTSQCSISLVDDATPAVVVTINFNPTTTAPASAWIYSVSSAGVYTKLVALTGTGLYELPGPRGRGGCHNVYSDCDLQSAIGFTLLGGLEQSYLSSQENETNGFLRAFTIARVPLTKTWTESTWAIIRDLGAPEANSNQNLVSAISNPDGTITSSSLSSIGYSVDFLIGLGLDHPMGKTNGQYSIGPIIALGATTPLSSASSTVGYAVPVLGTEECTQLQMRFASAAAYSQHYSRDLVAGTPGTSTPPNTTCLFNVAGGETPAAVATLAFSGINRSNFLEKWEVGARTIFRSHTTSGQISCDQSNPCQRGVVDFTLGQDAAFTGGVMRHFVFKVDGTQPIPYSGGYFYIFGTAALRFEKNTNFQPLILAAASSSALQTIPSPSVFVEPFMQPDKDFYRIGVGLSVDKIFTALKQTKSP